MDKGTQNNAAPAGAHGVPGLRVADVPKSGIPKFMDKLTSSVQDSARLVAEPVEGLMDSTKEQISDVTYNVKKSSREVMDSARETIDNVSDSVNKGLETTSEAWDAAVDSRAVRRVKDGFVDMIGKTLDAASLL